MKKALFGIIRLMDVVLSPFTILAAAWLKVLTRTGVYKTPVSEAVFMKFGVLPVSDHYYQPLINPRKHLTKSLRDDRALPGIDMNDEAQLALLECFNYNDELLAIPLGPVENVFDFYYDNSTFSSGDAEYLYNMIRYIKPAKIIEVGCGFSTLLSIKAADKNKAENPAHTVEHICVEPYEMPWLENTSATIIRKKVEDVDKSIFQLLNAGDIFFIDSSHMVRPQGDVLFQFLEVLPLLKPGVLVHVHDVFTPKDYLDHWVIEQHKLWNEQYVLEAFLTLNKEYEIIGAVNYLSHHHGEKLSARCPIFARQREREPGSFWIRKK